VPSPLWPSSIELACLVGAAPAHYLGNNLIALAPDLVQAGHVAFTRLESAHEPAAFINEFFGGAARRGDAVLLHWDYR